MNLKIKSLSFREFLAELLGTFTLVALGCGANANAKLASTRANFYETYVPLAWGMAMTVAIYISGGISGGHCNPGVTLGLASIGKLPWYKVPHYLASQFLGAFLGALVVFFVYCKTITNQFGEFTVLGPKSTANIFITYPSPMSTNAAAFLEQVVACAFFLLIINAIIDKKNMNCPKGLIPLAIGLADLSLVLLSFGYNSGGPINIARDFSPRILAAMVGYGKETFSLYNCYFWIPLIACPLGSILGCFIYKFFIEMHWPSDKETNESSNEPIQNNRLSSVHSNKF